MPQIELSTATPRGLPRLPRRVAQVAAATLLVAGVPVAIVWWLRASGAVSSAPVGVLIGMGLSLGISQLACLVWESLPCSEDLLFSELMIWGFVHRWHTQRRLASARGLLGPMTDGSAQEGLRAKDPVEVLERLVARMERSDPYLHGHSRRVARHSWMIAKRMGLSRDEVARIRTAAAVHDVGKINTPRKILHKAGPLTAEEYEVIKRHPGDGARMVAILRDAELTAIVRDHHERMDASGYPSGLSGNEIPLGARIIAVADTFDAITSTRAYRSARTHRQAIGILRDEAGVKLDAAAVRAFCSHYAGRHPLALWSSVAGLPGRMVSWLGESMAGVATMAKVVAVAALVSGAAVTSSTLGLTAAKRRSHGANPAPAVAPRPATGHATLVPTDPPSVPTASPRGQGFERLALAVARPSIHRRSVAVPSDESLAGAATAQPAPPSPTGTASGAVTGPGKSKTHELPGKRNIEEPAGNGRAEEAHGKGRPEEHAGRGKPEEPPAKGKPEEHAGKASPEEHAGKAAPEEAPGKGRPEETPGKGPIEAPPGKGKVEEAVANGKVEEAVAKGKGATKTSGESSPAASATGAS